MLSRQTPRSHLFALCAIVLVGLGFRCWGLTWGLHNADVSRRPHPDEWPVYWLFRWFGSTHSLNPCPTPGSRCFFDWGTVFPYIAYAVHFLVSPVLGLIPASAFGRQADLTFVRFVLAGRITTAVLSTATIVVVYQLARRAFGGRAGLAAALVMAISGLAIQLAHFATPDATTGFLMSCTLLAIFLAMQRPSLARFAVAGGLAGLTAGTEYHMFLLAVPLTTGWVLSERRDLRCLGTGYAAIAVMYLVSNPYILAEPGAYLSALEHAVRIRTVQSQQVYGEQWTPYEPAWLYVVRYALGYGVGFALTALMVASTVWAAIRRERADLLYLSWIVPYFLLVTLSPAKYLRYSAPLLPLLAVLAGRLIADCTYARRFAVGLVGAIAVVAAVLYSAAYDAAYIGLFSSTDPRARAVGWLTQHAPRGTQVGFDQRPNGLLNLPYFVSAAGYEPCFARFQASSLQELGPFIMVDSYDHEEHPRVSTAQATHYEEALQATPDYQVVKQVRYVPTFLGLDFPIDRSPHDWRYPSHVITVYRRSSQVTNVDPPCRAGLSGSIGAIQRQSSPGQG